MASIYYRLDKNGNKRYYGSIYNKGKRIRKFLAYSKRSAEASIKNLEFELFFNTKETEIQHVTFNQAILSFLKDVKRIGMKFNQYSIIRTKVNYFKDYCFSIDISDLDQVKRKHANQYILYRNSTGLTSSTLNKEYRFIKRFFNHCIMMGWINLNPFFGIKYIKDNRKLRRYFFTTDDLMRIFENSNIHHDFYSFLLTTGIRSTDAYIITPEHIKDGYLVKQMNKTGDWLNIPLSIPAKEIIDRRVKGNLIFPELQTPHQRRKCTEHLQSNFTADFVRKNNINLHTFRHTYAHNMLNKGVPKEVLQTLLGHRSIKTTEIYANWVRKEELEKWV